MQNLELLMNRDINPLPTDVIQLKNIVDRPKFESGRWVTEYLSSSNHLIEDLEYHVFVQICIDNNRFTNCQSPSLIEHHHFHLVPHGVNT